MTLHRFPASLPTSATSLRLALVVLSVLALASCGDSFPTQESEDANPADVLTDGGQLDVAVDVGDDALSDAESDVPSDVEEDVQSDVEGDSAQGDATDDADDVGPACPGGAGCSCAEDKDCTVGPCLPGAAGEKVCFAKCTAETDCGFSEICQAVPDTADKLCVPEGLSTNAPCTEPKACTVGDPTGVCASYGAEGSFCRPSCKVDGDCGNDETCATETQPGGASLSFCKTKTTPTCTAWAAATQAKTSCYAAGLPGCTAERSCVAKDGAAPALSACSPALPASEICDGLDNDCNGQADNDAPCDDGNPCTTDACANKACSHTANTAPCDDANACTKDDTCKAADLCEGVTITCDDNDVCTNDACDIATGCTATDNTAACDDGDACTKDDTCALGLCEGATVTCDDNNPCTDDACDPKTGCTATNNTAPCDDGLLCTKDDACAVGLCAGATVVCDDNDPCTDDACDPKAGCVTSFNKAPCTDGNACTKDDVCNGEGLCAGAKVDCEDGVYCTDNPCDPATGCALPINTTKTCDDGDACSEKDQCDGKGKCVGAAVNCEDGNACTDDPCDSKTGCAAKINTTKPCNDGDACTKDDACDGKGSCVSVQLDCEDGDQCTDDPCDSKTGCSAKINNTKPCSDLANCKTGGVCDGKGTCAGLKDSCDDNSPCTADSCLGGGKGCANVPTNNGGACDDGDACSLNDVCKAGSCVGAAKVCDDSNPCTDDVCLAGACTTTDNSASCDDGNPCTTGDVCAGGGCTGPKSKCEDGLQCTDDPCDGKTGACGLKILTTKPCNDGDACTTKDVCDGKGVCKGGALVACDDGNPCTIDSCDAKAGCVAKPAAGAACEDDNACTTETVCDAKGLCGGGKDGTGKACDDGNPCTDKDLCDAKAGCAGTPNAGCGTAIFSMPFTDSFACGATASPLWKPTDSKAGTLGWRIDALPSTPKPADGGCTLNFNDDVDFSTPCTGGIGPVMVGGPTIDGTKAVKPKMTFLLSGGWENLTFCNGPGDLCDWLQVVGSEIVDGKPVGPPVVLATPKSPGTSSWTKVEVDLSAFVGKTFAIGFSFGTDDCVNNDGTGPFIDNLSIFDSACSANPSACDDGNACTDDVCDAKTGACAHVNNDKQACDDGDACTTDACSAGKCLGTAKVCDDGDACTSNEACDPKTGKCAAATFATCDDQDPCTADTCDTKTGTCSSQPIANCAPACKADSDCLSSNFCLAGTCDAKAGTCSFAPTNEGAICGQGSLCAKGACTASTAGWARAVYGSPNGNFFCALTTDAKVACWGRNDQGQNGSGSSSATVATPTLVSGLSGVQQVAVGLDHACALLQDGATWCWGDNQYGQLGNKATADSNKPLLATEIVKAKAVSAGGDFTCWIDASDKAMCVGYASLGRLGHGSTSNSTSAVEVKGGGGAIAIASMYYNSCLLRADRTVMCWGYNLDRQVADASSTTYSTGVTRVGANGVFSIDGSYASVSWTTMTGGWSVGDNSDGQLGNGTTTDSAIPVAIVGPQGIIAVPGGDNHALALTTTGEVWGAGASSAGQLAIPETADQKSYIKTGFPASISVDGASDTTCAVTKVGTIVCAGSNTYGELGNGLTGGSSAVVGSVINFCKVDLACDDGDPCTSDACTDGQCAHAPASGASCDDGDGCTGKDVCTKGLCAGVPTVCDDGDACTLGESCLAISGTGVCVAGTPKTCDDGLPCTADSCDTLTGACKSTPVPGCLIGCKANADCDDGNPCTTDTCNATAGACAYKPGGDGLVCAVGSTCSGGLCAASKKGWAKSIHAGSYGDFSCAHTQSDAVACWGAGTQGQLGSGTSSNRSTAFLVKGLGKVFKVDAGTDHACALQTDGKLFCWGDNLYSALGDGKTSDSNVPVEAKEGAGAVDFCTGGDFTCIRTKGGEVKCWGYNNNGQLGDGTTTNSTTAKTVPGLTGVVAIDCEHDSVCAKTADGAVYCWGDNGDKEISPEGGTPLKAPTLRVAAGGAQTIGTGYVANCWTNKGAAWCVGDNLYGQLGNGTTSDSAEPVQVKGPAGILKIVGGYQHIVALDGEGKVWAAGYNANGQLGDGTTTNAKVYAPVKDQSVAVVDVATGRNHTCAVDATGMVWCLGDAGNGQLGNNQTANDAKAPVMVIPPCAADKDCDDGNLCSADKCNTTVGICANEAKVCDDGNACTVDDSCNPKDGQCVSGQAKVCDDGNECTLDSCDTKTGLCDAKPIKGCIPSCKLDADCPSTGSSCSTYTCVLSKCVEGPIHEGKVCDVASTCQDGDCVPKNKGPFQKISSFPYFGYHYCGVTNTGSGYCWGYNTDGQLGNGNTTNQSSPVLVKGLAAAVDINAGYRHTCAIVNGGKVFCWGQNTYGQIGNGTASSTDITSATETKALDKVVSVCAGYHHSCAVKADGTVWCWGGAHGGALGNGKVSTASSDNQPEPKQVPGLAGFQRVSCGDDWTCAVREDGETWCWGDNGYYQIEPSSTTDTGTPIKRAGLENVRDISTGGATGCATTHANAAFCFGYSSNGVANDQGSTATVKDPTELKTLGEVAMIVGGYNIAAAVSTSGDLWAWGANTFGGLANGTTTSNTKPSKVANVSGVLQVAVGYHSQCILLKNGTVECAGYNNYGQLGVGSTTNATKFAPISMQ